MYLPKKKNCVREMTVVGKGSEVMNHSHTIRRKGEARTQIKLNTVWISCLDNQVGACKWTRRQISEVGIGSKLAQHYRFSKVTWSVPRWNIKLHEMSIILVLLVLSLSFTYIKYNDFKELYFQYIKTFNFKPKWSIVHS